MDVYLKLKQDLVKERNHLDGIKTEFSLVDRATLNGMYTENNKQILDFKPITNLHLSEESYLILQKNSSFDLKITNPTEERERLKNREHLNMKLRMLDMTRTLDFMLETRGKQFQTHEEFYKQQREKLNTAFYSLQNKQYCEQDYEHELIKIIHESGLDTGLRTVSDYEQLLDYYRTMAGLLDPASILESVYEEGVGAGKITHQEVSVPVTVKTKKQQEKSFEVMENLVLDPSKSKVNFHSGLPAAFQEVNIAFSELIKLDNRRLGAQARTYLPGAHNAFVVRYAIQKGNENADVLISGRSASLAYMGKNESETKIADIVEENIEQLQQAVKFLGVDEEIGIIHLASNTSYKRENQMVKHTKAACAKKNIDYNNIPTNWAGIYLWNVISNAYQTAYSWWLGFLSIFSAAARYTLASELCLNTPDRVSFFVCAGGKDRSGITAEKTQIEFVLRKNKYGDRQPLEDVRSKMANAVQITTIANEGAPGVKAVSKARGLFGDEFAQALYRESATHNKEPKIGSMPFFDKGPQYLDILQYLDIRQGTKLEPQTVLPDAATVHRDPDSIKKVSSIEDLLKHYQALNVSWLISSYCYILVIDALCSRFIELLKELNTNTNPNGLSFKQTQKIKELAYNPLVKHLLTLPNRKKSITLTWDKLQKYAALTSNVEKEEDLPDENKHSPWKSNLYNSLLSMGLRTDSYR